jgi:hypothetical protein
MVAVRRLLWQPPAVKEHGSVGGPLARLKPGLRENGGSADRIAGRPGGGPAAPRDGGGKDQTV